MSFSTEMSSSESLNYDYCSKHADVTKFNNDDTFVFKETKAKSKNSAFLKRIPHFAHIDPTNTMSQFSTYSPFTFQESDPDERLISRSGLGKSKHKRKKRIHRVSSSSCSSISSMSLDDEIVLPYNWIQSKSIVLKANEKNRLAQQAAFLLNQRRLIRSDDKKRQSSNSKQHQQQQQLQVFKKEKSVLNSKNKQEVLNEKTNKNKLNNTNTKVKTKEDYAAATASREASTKTTSTSTTNNTTKTSTPKLSSTLSNDGLLFRNINQEESNKVKSFIKKNPHILINICITNNNNGKKSNAHCKMATNSKNSYENYNQLSTKSNKKKASLLKSASSASSSSDSLNEKKKIRFIYGDERPHNHNSYTNRSTNSNRVKFNDVIEFYDPEYKNRTLFTLSEYSLNKNNNKIRSKYPNVEFCYESPTFNESSNLNTISRAPLSTKPAANARLDKSDFIYYFDDYMNQQNNNLINENEDLIELDADESKNSPKYESLYEQFDDMEPVKQSETKNNSTTNNNHSVNNNINNNTQNQPEQQKQQNQSQPQTQQNQLFANTTNLNYNFNSHKNNNIINNNKSPLIKTRGIVQIKSNSFLKDFTHLTKFDTLNKLKQVNNGTSNNTSNNDSINKTDEKEIELSIKLSPDLNCVNGNAMMNSNKNLINYTNSMKETLTSETETTPKQENLITTSFTSRKFFQRRSSKSGESSNENELNSIFKQIYNRTLITSAASTSCNNSNATNQTSTIRRFSSVNNHHVFNDKVTSTSM